jgi:hypothetical protein
LENPKGRKYQNGKTWQQRPRNPRGKKTKNGSRKQQRTLLKKRIQKEQPMSIEASDGEVEEEDESKKCECGHLACSGATKLGKLVMWFLNNITKINTVITVLVIVLIIIGGGVVWSCIRRILG